MAQSWSIANTTSPEALAASRPIRGLRTQLLSAQEGYCEACSSCGMIFFHWKMNLAYHEANYVDIYEDTIYNALLGLSEPVRQVFLLRPTLSTPPVARSTMAFCPCCVGNIRGHSPWCPTWAYSRTQPIGLYVEPAISASSILLENVAAPTSRWCRKPTTRGAARVAHHGQSAGRSKQFTVRMRIPDRGASEFYKPSPELERDHRRSW
ncbi:MAG: glycoside hydrolase family 127 protein [Paludibaculum sp.]